jgi:hypothetical protein
MPTTIKTPTILAGQSLSDAFDASGALQLFIVTPAVWTSANVTFQASIDTGTNFFNLFGHLGPEIMLAMGDRLNAMTVVDITDFPKAVFLKLRSGTRNSPVVQAQDAVFQVGVMT